MITFTELREQLGISQRALSKFVADGLPHQVEGRRKLFDEDAVAQWLVDMNLATLDEDEPSPPVARTRKECAEHFGVHLRTVADWLEEESFPGRAGTRGRRDGYFPLDEIAEWIRQRDALRSGGPQIDLPDLRNELLAIRIERERRRNQEEEGSLAPIADMVELVQRLTNAAKRILESVPDEAAKELPADMSDKVKAAIVKRWRRKIGQIERVISEAIAGDMDETEDE